MKFESPSFLVFLFTISQTFHAFSQNNPIQFINNENKLNQNWDVVTNTGESRLTLYSSRSDKSIKFHCIKSSFSIQQKTSINLDQTPIVSWDWKASKLPTNGDLRYNNTNDQVLQVIFAFNKTFFGFDAISYVWDTSAPVGENTIEGYKFLGLGIKVVVIVLRSGETQMNSWNNASRNIKEDLNKYFGSSAEIIEGIRIQCNCQHTNSSSTGYIKNLQFMVN